MKALLFYMLLYIRYIKNMVAKTTIPTIVKNFLLSRLSKVSFLFLLLVDILQQIGWFR